MTMENSHTKISRKIVNVPKRTLLLVSPVISQFSPLVSNTYTRATSMKWGVLARIRCLASRLKAFRSYIKIASLSFCSAAAPAAGPVSQRALFH
jgi:hypothetical protein